MSNIYDKSERLYGQALKYMPGGVNSPVRAFQAVGGSPVFIASGEGALLTDVDGNSYLDYVGSWGPLILGHRPAQVIQALQECLARGTSFGAPTEAETQLAQMIVQALPCMDMVRLVNSGTEATMSAVRLARGYTGRDKIIKFAGCYHGHADFLLIKAGSGALTLGTPTSPGIPEDTAKHTIVAPYNHLESLKDIFAQIGEEIAAVIIEPIAGNMGVVPPAPGFLDGLRELTAQYGTLLIFDEVMTGFRVAYGGAQELYGIEPDLTTLGKIIGGGLPVGAYAGKQEIMSCIAPAGPIYQAGTLSGNPLAVTAGLAALGLLNNPRVYQELEQKSARLEAGLRIAAKETELDLVFNRVGSMLGMFFSADPVVDYDTATKSDTAKYAKYFRGMLNKGIYLAPSQFEAVFMSLAHTDEQIDYTIEAAREVLREIRDA